MNYQLVFFEAAAGTAASLPPSDVPEVCFSGRSNVGKSSLINRILNRKSFARVSTKPGKTVTVNFYRLPGLRLADLPGYGYAKVSFSEKKRWSDLMETYFGQERNLKTVFQLIDSRHPATQEDLDMLSYLRGAGRKTVLVFTKWDKLSKAEKEVRRAELTAQLAPFAEMEFVFFSAVTGEGVDRIRLLLEAVAD